MIPMTDEDSDMVLGQSFESTSQASERSQTPVGGIMNIARDQKKIHFSVDTEINDSFEGLKRGFPQDRL
jgi:hypothetical protein